MQIQRVKHPLCTLVFLALIVAGCARTPAPASSPTSAPPVLDQPLRTGGLAAVYPAAAAIPVTEAQLAQVVVPARDLRDITVRLRPDVDAVPEVVNDTAPDHAVGDQIQFWVHDLRTRGNQQIAAELIHKTDVAYAWVEAGQRFDRNAIVRAVDHFSAHSYPALTAVFGSEWNPGVDNDPRLHILHTTGTGSGVAGYYSSADQYSRLANPYSNEKEMFYINLDWLNGMGDYRHYETVLAHEFQHMIHWRNDSNEATWVNEGLSEFAQEIAGFGADTGFVGSFMNQPDTQLNAWSTEPVGNAAQYGASYLFIHYLHQRYGADLLRRLVAEPANDIEGVQLALDAQGAGVEFDALFADWIIANYANQPDALGQPEVYGYRALDFARPVTAHGINRYPAGPIRDTVRNYAAHYLRLGGNGDLTVRFAGQAETRLAEMPLAGGHYVWWSNMGDSSNSRLTRQVDLRGLTPGAPVTMEAAMWWDIEENYDYGYVVASRDGRKWTILPGLRTTLENPAGNSFGAAFTGKSDADRAGLPSWVQEQFDLSEFAGEEIWLRFEYITDDAINGAGWFIGDVRIPAIGYVRDFTHGPGDWESEGWLLTDNRLPQRWLLQVMTFDGDALVEVQRPVVDELGNAEFTIDGLGDGRRAVLAISALAPVTTQPAAYEVTFMQSGE